MEKAKQLPYKEPPYCTYQYMAGAGVAAMQNPTAYNYYLNQCMILLCDKAFLTGYTSPRLNVNDAAFECLPFLERAEIRRSFIDGAELQVVRNMIDNGYYVYFNMVDSFYIDGMLWSGEYHNFHDGLICGYDDNDHTLTLAAYDKRWAYGSFKTAQEGFVKALASGKEKGGYEGFIGFKVQENEIKLDIPKIAENLRKYLAIDPHSCEFEDRNTVRGIAVHDYLRLYLQFLLDGEIPYERKDRRIMRLIYEHKRCMADRIAAVEEKLGLPTDIRREYAPVVESAKRAHAYYVSYRLKQRDELLCMIQGELEFMKATEEKNLPDFLRFIQENYHE